jgi:hypothetical protein
MDNTQTSITFFGLTQKLHLSGAWLPEKSFVPAKVGIEIKRL